MGEDATSKEEAQSILGSLDLIGKMGLPMNTAVLIEFCTMGISGKISSTEREKKYGKMEPYSRGSSSMGRNSAMEFGSPASHLSTWENGLGIYQRERELWSLRSRFMREDFQRE